MVGQPLTKMRPRDHNGQGDEKKQTNHECEADGEGPGYPERTALLNFIGDIQCFNGRSEAAGSCPYDAQYPNESSVPRLGVTTFASTVWTTCMLSGGTKLPSMPRTWLNKFCTGTYAITADRSTREDGQHKVIGERSGHLEGVLLENVFAGAPHCILYS